MNKLKPAILGGLIVGILSSIPLINYCCCIWGIGGGLLAGMIYIKGSPAPVSAGEGAVVGALTGVVGALIYLILGVPVAYLISGGGAVEDQLRASGLSVPFSGLLLFVVAGLIGAVILAILAVLGGLLAVPLFEKRKGAPPPPPPAGL